MSTKIRVGILFGGKSAEHEISLQSARNIVDAIDREKYEVTLLGIDQGGRWHLSDVAALQPSVQVLPRLAANGSAAITLVPEAGTLLEVAEPRQLDRLDVIFPVLHGPFGEDGTVQGMLKLADIPFVGADVLGSAVGMDKDVMKRLLREAGIPIGRFRTLQRKHRAVPGFEEVVDDLGLPFYVKPANLGSSVGISRVSTAKEFAAALEDAFRFDHKVLLEENIDGREIECAVLGNDTLHASLPGEIIPSGKWYSYRAKYLDEQGASLEIPAQLDVATIKAIQQLSIKVCETLGCEGMARVDLFLGSAGELYVNEINTIPGFTNISMYPRLWEVSGISYPELIDRLLQLALERHRRDKQLKTSYTD